MIKTKRLRLARNTVAVLRIVRPSTQTFDTVNSLHGGLTNCLFGCSGASCGCPPD